MTWYRFRREIGDDMGLANYMLDGTMGAHDDPDSPVWARKFMEYINEQYTAYDILVDATILRVGVGLSDYFVDWVIEMAQYDPYFGEVYCFDWEDDEDEDENGQEEEE